ncbi:HNH endonuclease [bacterium]|nr:HNH endonuclease [bacterium]
MATRSSKTRTCIQCSSSYIGTQSLCSKECKKEYVLNNKINRTSKKCNGCNTIKQVTEFHGDSYSSDGYRYECKKCAKLRKKNNPSHRGEPKKHDAIRRTLSEENWKTLVEISEGLCALCKISLSDLERSSDPSKYNKNNAVTVDHVFPKSKGGSHELSNLQLLCRACNVIKSDKI